MPTDTPAPDVAELRRLLAHATPGPWGWRGNDDGLVELRGGGPFGDYDGRVISAQRCEPCIVTLEDETVALAYGACDTCRAALAEAARRGTSGPLLDLRCDKPDNLATVWLNGLQAIQPANTWAVRQVSHRSDVADVDHPDAQLIAAARTALPWLLDQLDARRADDSTPATPTPTDAPPVTVPGRMTEARRGGLAVLLAAHRAATTAYRSNTTTAPWEAPARAAAGRHLHVYRGISDWLETNHLVLRGPDGDLQLTHRGLQLAEHLEATDPPPAHRTTNPQETPHEP